MIARVPHRSGVTLIVSVSSVAGTRRDVEIGTMSCRRGDLVAKRKNNSNTVEGTAAPLGYEAQLWQMANAPRGSMDATEQYRADRIGGRGESARL